MNRIAIGFLPIIIFLSACGNRNVKKTYYDSGELRDEFEVSNNGLANGYYKKYYENGKLEFFAYYKNNKRNGSYIGYYLNGNIKTKCFYLNDLPEGVDTDYYKNGKIKAVGHYLNGKENGAKVFYSSDGKLNDYQLMKDDSLLYEKSYDSLENDYIERWKVWIISQTDSIKLGYPFKAKFDFYDEDKFKNVKIEIMLNTKDQYLSKRMLETAQDLKKDNYCPGYQFEFTPKQANTYYLWGNLDLVDEKGIIHYNPFVHHFTVYQ